MRTSISLLLTVMVVAACSGGSTGTSPASSVGSTSVPTATSVPTQPASPSPSAAATHQAETPTVTSAPSAAPTQPIETAPATSVPSSLPSLGPAPSFEAATTIEVQLRTAESTITSTTNTSEVACARDAAGGSALRVTFENPGAQQGVIGLEVFVPDTQAPREGFTATVEYSSDPAANPYRLTGDQVRRNSIDLADRDSSASISFSGDARTASLSVRVDCHQIGA